MDERLPFEEDQRPRAGPSVSFPVLVSEGGELAPDWLDIRGAQLAETLGMKKRLGVQHPECREAQDRLRNRKVRATPAFEGIRRLHDLKRSDPEQYRREIANIRAAAV